MLCIPLTLPFHQSRKGRGGNLAGDVSKLHPYWHLTYLLIGLLAFRPIFVATIPEILTSDCMMGVEVAAGCYAAPVKVFRC